MSRTRQRWTIRGNPSRNRSGREVVRFAHDYGHRTNVLEHRHPRDQLLFASSGVMTISADDGLYVVPPNRAAWVPAGVSHSVRMFGDVSMRTLYFRPRLAGRLPRKCCILNVDPLLRELVLFVVALPSFQPRRRAHGHLLQVILDQLASAVWLPLYLPMPRDSRAVEVAKELLNAPADRRALAEWGRLAHASKRTLERLFKHDTGMSFRVWRTHARMHQALILLSADTSVTNTAFDVGYGSTSAFVAAFRRTLGASPTRYLRGSRDCAATKC